MHAGLPNGIALELKSLSPVGRSARHAEPLALDVSLPSGQASRTLEAPLRSASTPLLDSAPISAASFGVLDGLQRRLTAEFGAAPSSSSTLGAGRDLLGHVQRHATTLQGCTTSPPRSASTPSLRRPDARAFTPSGRLCEALAKKNEENWPPVWMDERKDLGLDILRRQNDDIGTQACLGGPERSVLASKLRHLVDSEVHQGLGDFPARSPTLSSGSLVRPEAVSPALGSGTSGASGVSGPNSPRGRGTYELMKQALQDAQRRVEVLNNERLKQSQAYDDLLTAFQGSEESNRRLMEQVGRQTEELSMKAQKHVDDQEFLGDFRRKVLRLEEEKESEVRLRVQAAVEEAGNTHLQLVTAAKVQGDRFRSLQAKLQAVLKAAAAYGADRAEHRRSTLTDMDSLRQHMLQVERVVTQQLQSFVNRQMQAQVACTSATAQLERQCTAERELRLQDASKWMQQRAELQRERDDVQARSTLELEQMRSQLQAMERSHQDEKQQYEERLQQFEDQKLAWERRGAAEQELRLQEVSTWIQQKAGFQRERDDAQARLTLELGQMRSQLQGMESSHQEEKWQHEELKRYCEEQRRHYEQQKLQLSEELITLRQQVKDQAQRCAQLEHDRQRLTQEVQEKEHTLGGLERLEETHRDAARAAEAKHAELEAGIAELRSKLQDSEQSFCAAVLNSDGLKQQLESQAQQAGEATLQAATAAALAEAAQRDLEQQIEDLNHQHLLEQTQFQELELRLRACSEQLAEARLERTAERNRAQESERARAELQQFVDFHQLQAEECESMRIQSRQLEERLATSQAQESQARCQVRELEKELGQLRGKLGKITAEHQVTVEEREAQKRDCEEQLAKAQQAIVEATEAAQRQCRAVAELQEQLQVTAEERERLEVECRRLEEALAEQLRGGQEERERWRQAHLHELRQAQALLADLAEAHVQAQAQMQEDSQLQSAALERERSTLERERQQMRQEQEQLRQNQEIYVHRMDTQEQQSLQQRRRLEEQDRELHRLNQELETAKRAESIAKEVTEKAQRDEVQKRQGLEQQVKHLSAELEVVRGKHQQDLTNQQQELQKLREAHQEQMRNIEGRRNTEVAAASGSLREIREENERLQQLVSQQRGQHRRCSSISMSGIQQQLESHIWRLQQQTNQLEGREAQAGLARSTPSTGALSRAPGLDLAEPAAASVLDP